MSTISTQLPAPSDSVGGRIKQARGYVRLTGAQLGDAVGVSRETISSWENNKTSPTADELVKVAKKTGFSAAWFLDGMEFFARYHPFPKALGSTATPLPRRETSTLAA